MRVAHIYTYIPFRHGSKCAGLERSRLSRLAIRTVRGLVGVSFGVRLA